MDRLAIILIITFCLNYSLFATEQISDRLLIGNDTICLKSFPLEKLELKTRPFKYGKYHFPHTGCWRGYRATWEVIESKLYLIEIEKVDSTQQKLDIKEYFSENGLTYDYLNGKIFAEWYSGNLEKYFVHYAKDCLYESYAPKKRKTKLKFSKGILILNKLTENYGQDFNKSDFRFNPDTLDLSTTEKIYRQKDFLINCMSYYLSKNVGNLSQERMNCFKVFLNLSWNDDFKTGLVKYHPRKLIRGMNMAYASVYWLGQTKLKLENPDLIENDSLLVSKSVELFLDYCFDEDNNVHISKERKRVQDLREQGELALYIKELIAESEKKNKK